VLEHRRRDGAQDVDSAQGWQVVAKELRGLSGQVCEVILEPFEDVADVVFAVLGS